MLLAERLEAGGEFVGFYLERVRERRLDAALAIAALSRLRLGASGVVSEGDVSQLVREQEA